MSEYKQDKPLLQGKVLSKLRNLLAVPDLNHFVIFLFTGKAESITSDISILCMKK